MVNLRDRDVGCFRASRDPIISSLAHTLPAPGGPVFKCVGIIVLLTHSNTTSTSRLRYTLLCYSDMIAIDVKITVVSSCLY